MVGLIEEGTRAGRALNMLSTLLLDKSGKSMSIDGGRHGSNQSHGRLLRMQAEDQDTTEEPDLRVLRAHLDPHRIIYGTIILMTAFALYDQRGATDPLGPTSILALCGIVIAPLFALAMAHAFSEALDLQIRRRSTLTAQHRRLLLATNMQYLYLAVPPIIVMVVLSLMGMDPFDVIGVVEILGLVSLFAWGTYAGRKAYLSTGKQLLMGLGYMLTGATVIAIELALTH